MKDRYKELGLWFLGGCGVVLLLLVFVWGLSVAYTINKWATTDGVEQTMIEEMRIETEDATIYIKGLHIEVSSRWIIPMLINAISD